MDHSRNLSPLRTGTGVTRGRPRAPFPMPDQAAARDQQQRIPDRRPVPGQPSIISPVSPSIFIDTPDTAVDTPHGLYIETLHDTSVEPPRSRSIDTTTPLQTSAAPSLHTATTIRSATTIPKKLNPATTEKTLRHDEEDGDGRPSESHWLGAWWQELLSSVVSILCLGAIVIVLIVHENASVTRWPLPIPINSLIAVFTAIMKACLIFPVSESIGQLKWLRLSTGVHSLSEIVRFDMATRGPWGCLRLLVLQLFKPGRSYFATLGAIITIAALALEPFSQAMVSLEKCQQPLASKATVPRANFFANRIGAPTDEMRIPEIADTVGLLSESMQRSIYLGLIQPPANSSAMIEPQCSTGECTFLADSDGASFQTIAMCHSCIDITDHAVVNPESRNNFSLPSGASVDDYNVMSCVSFDSMSDDRQFAQNDTMIGFECLAFNNYNTGYEAPFGVSCSLSPCVKTYSANITAAQYTETVLSTEMIDSTYNAVAAGLGSQIFSYVHVADSALRNGIRQPCTSVSNASDTHIIGVWPEAEFVTDDVGFPISQHWYTPDCVWGVSDSAMSTIRFFISDKFNGHKVQWPLNSAEPWLRAAFQNGGASMETFNKLIEGVALAMSAEMRLENATAVFSTGPLEGTAWEADTCVGVRWQWIAFPASLMVLEFILLFATIDRGRRGDWRGDWKSSPLPLLFNAPTRDDIVGAAKDMRVGDMEEKAGLLNFKLQRDEDEGPSGGWRLGRVV